MRISRRGALAVGAGLTAAAIAARSGPLGLIDPQLPPRELGEARRGLGDLSTFALEPDAVAQWRRGLGRRVARRGAVALVRWDKALILAGLAREAGLKVRQTRLSRSLFRLELA
jgi:hypothetical protein